MRRSPSPRSYELLEGEGIRYAIRLPANPVLQRRIGHLLTRPVGRPPKKPIVSFASFRYEANGWSRVRRVVAKIEWHQGELYPRVGFIVTNLTRPVNSTTAAALPSSISRKARTRFAGRACPAMRSAATLCGSSCTPFLRSTVS